MPTYSKKTKAPELHTLTILIDDQSSCVEIGSFDLIRSYCAFSNASVQHRAEITVSGFRVEIRNKLTQVLALIH